MLSAKVADFRKKSFYSKIFCFKLLAIEYEYRKNTKKYRIPRLHQFCERLPVFSEPYSLLELPPQRSTKEAFLSYSRPLEEVDKEQLQKLKELGYDETFRVVSFNGLGKSKKDFNGRIKDYETVLEDCVKAIPCSFCFCNTESKVYDLVSSPNAIEDRKRSFLTCLLLKPWWEKSKTDTGAL